MYRILCFISLCALSTLAAAETPPHHAATQTPPANNLPNKGLVQETIDAGSYTYINVENEGEQQWIAVSKTAVSKGMMIRYSKGTQMGDFYSKSLDRTFPKILFIGAIKVVEGGDHPTITQTEEILNISQDEVAMPNLGRVLSTIPSSNYTYIEVDQKGTIRWLAVPSVSVKDGAMVRYADGALMKNFFSKKLDREFPEITFLGGIKIVEE